MKLLNNRIISLFSILSIALIWSCNPDDSTISPDEDYRDNFVGTWRFNESSYKYDIHSYYTVVITKDPSNSAQVLLSNFGNPGSGSASVYGIVTQNNITVPQQTTGDNWLIKGSGVKITDTKMTWQYVITIGGDEHDYSATAEKQ